jgi:hypothetical protein
MRAGLGLAGFAQQGFAESAGWKHPGFVSQALRFFGKTFFKGYGLFETAALHENLPRACGSYTAWFSTLAMLICTRAAVRSLVHTN